MTSPRVYPVTLTMVATVRDPDTDKVVMSVEVRHDRLAPIQEINRQLDAAGFAPLFNEGTTFKTTERDARRT